MVTVKASVKRNRCHEENHQAASAKKSVLIAGLALPLLLLALAPGARGQGLCNTSLDAPLMALNGSLISGHASLFRGGGELDVLIGAENLTPGVAYTAWFIYYDDTSKCLTPHQCGPSDLTMPASNPEGVFGRMDSAVAGADGRLAFKGSMRNFRISFGSAVHVVLFSHGPADTIDNRERARQLLTPESPGLGAPGLGGSRAKGLACGGRQIRYHYL